LSQRGFEVDEERMLAGRLAGVLFMTAGVSMLLLLLVPGVEDSHWRWVAALSAVCGVWAIYCLAFARPEEHGPWFWHVPAILAIPLISGLIASTGGVDSPARFVVFFLLFYTCYFYRPRHARLYVVGCIGIALTPLLYDRSAVSGGYLGELIVLCAAYATLGWLIIAGKGIMVGLREQARSLSLRDPLTDLPNRRAMLEWLGRHMERGGRVGLVLADLDGFKDVNTLHGYPVGDAVLCETARTLEKCVRSGDMVARLGGDEFAVLTLRADKAGLEALCGRLLDAVREMPRGEAHNVALTVSLGWALYPDDARTIDELVATADLCVRSVKLKGKNRIVSAGELEPQVPAGEVVRPPAPLGERDRA
jgi:diguanylate cyclase (GGDEF)-like protein